MFTQLIAWFQASDWFSIIDYVVVAVLARYIPSLTPVYDLIKKFISKFIP